MSVVTSVRHRVDPAPLTALAALGDLVCIGVFVVGGATSGHGFDPVADAPRLASTFATFAVGWTLASVLAGVHSADARRSVRAAIRRTIPAWLVAAAVAQALRATPQVPGRAALTLYAVSVVVVLAMLVPWRVAVTVAANRS